MKNLLWAALCLVLCFGALFAFTACLHDDDPIRPDDNDPYTLVKIGDTVPEGSITDITGALTYNTMQRDSAVVIYFLWSECSDCHAQTPIVLSLTDGTGHIPGVKLVCVARGDADATLGKAEAYWASAAASTGRTMPPLYYDENRAFYSLFAAQTVPRFYFIDRGGTVRHLSAVVTDSATLARFTEDIR